MDHLATPTQSTLDGRLPAETVDVFDIDELLEMIIAKIPFKDLLTKQQLVCKHWQHVITTTASIRNQHFFGVEACNAQRITASIERGEGYYRRN